MDAFGLLGYVNKFSLLAFILTLGVLVYQVYLLRKDSKADTKVPVIPDFNENLSVPSLNYSPIDSKVETEKNKGLNLNLIILIVITVGVVLFLFFSIFMKSNNNTAVQEQKAPLVKLTASKGIKIYDSNWVELDEAKISKLVGGDAIIGAIDKTSDVSIDKARIRMNKSAWVAADEDLKFDKTRNVYYKNFIVATDAAFLKIEAQLHHASDGWLGE